MFEALGFAFMQQAVLAGVLVSIAAGVIGALVVVNRLVFLSGGVAHSAYGGIGLAFFLGIPPLLGAGLVGVLSALLMAWVTLTQRHRSDTVIGVIWAVGMALGVVLIDLTPGYGADLMSYLFGSIMAAGWGDLVLFALLDVAIVGLVAIFYRPLLALSFDDRFARIKGVKVRTLYLMMLVLAALTVVMAIRVVGLMLVIALLTIPTWMAERHAATLAGMMALAALYAAVFTLAGLALAYGFNLTSGAAIILAAGCGFVLSEGAARLKRAAGY
ncbi:MAG: metal ABC transporter permease [Campylobacterales bacterium]